MSFEWLDIAKRIQAIAQTGLEFSDNKYDIERYQILRDISIEIMHEFTGTEMLKIKDLFASEEGYQTPKVDIRGVVFRDNKILMVRETIDGLWTLPGGWADVGYTPFEIAEKEVYEEAGLKVKPVRLLAVYDKIRHEHPPDKWHVYKLFILCKDSRGEIKTGMETSDAGWFNLENIPPLSTPRITREQIETMFEFLINPDKPVICD